MSYVSVLPATLATAATEVARIGSALSLASAVAAAQTSAVQAAAADEVSAAIAALFSAHGRDFQALSARAAAFHHEFVQALAAGAGSYAVAEIAAAGLSRSDRGRCDADHRRTRRPPCISPSPCRARQRCASGGP
ncbi:PE family protein, partial [Mycobacterium tuberculosis]|uniref:PE family protein n=1 Tax=Mycobacterium tuberculosis TaxID=1773 RepID=UPI00214E9A0B